MFNKIKISSGLKISGIVMALLTLLLVIGGYSMVTRISSATNEMYNRGMVGSKLLTDSNNAVWELRFGIANYTLATPENRKKIIDGRPQLYDSLEESLRKYAVLGASNEQDPALKELLDVYRQYKAGAPTWFELIDADKLSEAAEYRAKVTNVAGGAMVKNIKALIEKQLKINEDLEQGARTAAEKTHNLLIAFGIASLLIVVASATLLVQAIAAPLSQMQAEIEEIERSSDFTRRVTVTSDNEIGQTAKSFNKLMSTMQVSMRQLLDNVDQVSMAVSALTSSSDRLAAGSAQQSEATASIAATVDQITASINQVSDSAHNAMEISMDSGELSSRGRDVIQKTVAEVLQIAHAIRQTSAVIEELGQQSNKISSVVQVIKEVADQTNLLALNAAIEAARAGEQGRGFAVVADEVRKLAERTTKSTIEITQMIGSIQNSSGLAVSSMSNAVSQMDGGVTLAQQASDAINLIKDRASEVTSVVNRIAAALGEQSSASNNIATRVEDVAQMTETNNIATNDIAAAIHDLEKLADVMRAVGHRFRI